MKQPMLRSIAILLWCMAALLAAVPSFADDPIVIQFVGVSPPVSGCACQAVEVTVKARDYDSTTSGVGYDDLVFQALPYGSGWTPAAAPWRDGNGWWYQTFRKTFGAPGEYPSAEGEYIFRALDLDIFHGENDLDDQVVRTKVIIQDHYEMGTGITCTIDNPANGAGYAPSATVACTATASDVDKKNCQDIGDTVTYLWSATGGSFSGSTTNSTATWIAPPGAGAYTISVRVDDADDPANPPYCGLRSDNAVTKTVDVTVGIIHVSKSGNNTDGLTWGTAKGTVQAGLNAAVSGNEVWVAAGMYVERITLKSGVALYGGFAGTEWRREDRNWRTRITTLDADHLGSVVTSPSGAGATTIIDGFTITNGSAYYGGGVYCANSSPTISNNTITNNSAANIDNSSGGGIYCYSSSARIQGNIIRENSSSTTGGGIYCGSCPNISIINNQIDRNTAWWDGGAIQLDESSGLIASNTIVENTATTGSTNTVYAVSIPWGSYSVTLANNIIAYNSAGVCGGGNNVLRNNDVYHNPEVAPQFDYCDGLVHDTDISEPPLFADRPVGNYHLQPNSLCRNAGDNSVVQTGQLDMDGQSRILNGTVDIGADESDGCGWYNITLSTTAQPGTPGDLVTVTANVKNWYNLDVEGVTVYFSVSAGTITEINGNSLPSGTTEASGKTNPTGSATIKVTRPNAGPITVTAEVSNSCSTGQTTRSIDLTFSVKVGFLYDLCLDHPQVRPCIDQFLTLINQQYPWVSYQRITGTPFSVDGSFNTVFLVMPTRNLEPSESASLSAFVQSGRNKRIVLVGDYNPGWSLYNERLNNIAIALGLGSRFSTTGGVYDGTGRLCTVTLGHYLMDGVVGLWDWAVSTFETVGAQAEPLAYVNETLPTLLPWILEEDTVSAGSRILIHDSTMMLMPNYGYYYDTVPDKNFKFIYNLCTIFPQ